VRQLGSPSAALYDRGERNPPLKWREKEGGMDLGTKRDAKVERRSTSRAPVKWERYWGGAFNIARENQIRGVRSLSPSVEKRGKFERAVGS